MFLGYILGEVPTIFVPISEEEYEMEIEKFEISRSIVKYACGCTQEIIGFENCLPNERCEKHDKGIVEIEKI